MNDKLSWLMDITDLGDAAVLATVSLVIGTYLAATGARRESAAVFSAFIIPASIIACLKIAFYTCNANLWGIESPSGHSAISIGVLGVSALVLLKRSYGVWRVILQIILVGLVILIPISRKVLGMHSVGDVLVGCAVGIWCVFFIAKNILRYRRENEAQVALVPPTKTAHPMMLYGLVVLAIVVTYGKRLPSEQFMHSAANHIRSNFALLLDVH